MRTMRAVVFEGRENMRVEDAPRPQCGPREALLRVAACAICGGDARTYFVGDKYTGACRIPGHEIAGVIAEAGEESGPWRVGDRVALAADVHCGDCWYCRRELFNMCEHLRILGKHIDGGMAEYMLLDEDILTRGIINRVPEELPLRHAAVSEPICSVLASHDELGIQAGESVAVIGCGPMGILHLCFLAERGARTIMIDLSAARLGRARQDFGAEHAIDGSGEDAVARVRELCEGVGADVVIAAAPSAAAVQQAVAMARRRGRIGVFGGLPAAQACVTIDVNLLHYSELRLVGNFSYHPRYHERALTLLAAGAIDCGKLITEYPIENTRQALHDIRDGNVLKAVVLPTEEELD